VMPPPIYRRSRQSTSRKKRAHEEMLWLTNLQLVEPGPD